MSFQLPHYLALLPCFAFLCKICEQEVGNLGAGFGLVSIRSACCFIVAVGPPLLFPIYFQYMIFKHPIVRRNWLVSKTINLFVQRLINMIYLQADSFSELFSKSIQCISKISLMLCLYNANLGAMLVFTLQQNSVKNESQLRD